MAELGERIGVTAAAVSRYELGQRAISVDMLERIANALNVHIFDLVGLGEQLGKFRVKYEKIEPLPGNPEDLTPEKIAEVEKILSSDPRDIYDRISDKDKSEFWQMLTQIDRFSDIDGSRSRVDAALDQMTEEGRGKVADYAEDILPRYRRQDRTESPEDVE